MVVVVVVVFVVVVFVFAYVVIDVVDSRTVTAEILLKLSLCGGGVGVKTFSCKPNLR